MEIEPDGFIGGVMAVEGITDATVTLHGQRGCRKGLLISEMCMPRPERDRLVDVPYYAGHRTVPYSCMTFRDYYGESGRRISEAIRYVSTEGYELNIVLCSPGLSMIGDDLATIPEGTMVYDRDGLDCGCAEGYDRMTRDIITHLASDVDDVIPDSIAILGLSIMHKDWRTVRQEFTKYLTDAGHTVVSVPGAGCTVQELRDCTRAEYAVILDPDHCALTADLLSREHGVKIISTGCAPIGFDAVANLYEAIGDATGHRLTHGFRMLDKTRGRAYESIVASGRELIGTTYSINASESVSSPLSRWLETSFGMVSAEGVPDVLFASGDRVISELESGRCRKGVDIGFPSSSRVDFQRSPVMGLDGSLYLLDRLFNRRSC